VSVVPANRGESEEPVKHPGVDMISFTGSTAAGSAHRRDLRRTNRNVVPELGGKSASIVLDDVDVAAAATVLHTGMLLNDGEACMA
jgi:aldehyde dehydrogenase (NAD+)